MIHYHSILQLHKWSIHFGFILIVDSTILLAFYQVHVEEQHGCLCYGSNEKKHPRERQRFLPSHLQQSPSTIHLPDHPYWIGHCCSLSTVLPDSTNCCLFRCSFTKEWGGADECASSDGSGSPQHCGYDYQVNQE